MSNENPIKPSIEIETTGNPGIQSKLEQVDIEEGYDKAFEAVKETLLSAPLSYYIKATDTGVSVFHRSSADAFYFTDIPKEMEILKSIGLEENTIFDSEPGL